MEEALRRTCQEAPSSGPWDRIVHYRLFMNQQEVLLDECKHLSIGTVSRFLVRYAVHIVQTYQVTVMLEFDEEVEQVHRQTSEEELSELELIVAKNLLDDTNHGETFSITFTHLNADRSNQIRFKFHCVPQVRTQTPPQQIVEVKNQECNGVYLNLDPNGPKDYETKPGVILILNERMDAAGQCHERINLLALWAKDNHEDYIGLYDEQGGTRTNQETRLVYKLPMTGQWVLNAWNTLLVYQHVQVFYLRHVGDFYIGSHEALGEVSRIHGTELSRVYELSPLNRTPIEQLTVLPAPPRFTLSMHTPATVIDLRDISYTQLVEAQHPFVYVTPTAVFTLHIARRFFELNEEAMRNSDEYFMSKEQQANIMVDTIRQIYAEHVNQSYPLRIDQTFWEMVMIELREIGYGALFDFFQYNEVLRARINQTNASIHMIPKVFYDREPPIKVIEGDRIFPAKNPRLPNNRLLTSLRPVRTPGLIEMYSAIYLDRSENAFYHDILSRDGITTATPYVELDYLRRMAVANGVSLGDLWVIHQVSTHDVESDRLPVDAVSTYQRFLGVRIREIMRRGGIRVNPWGPEPTARQDLDEKILGKYRYGLLEFRSAPYTQLTSTEPVQ